MSNPAQGAVGAETMTAAERVCHEEQMVIWSSEIAERLAMGDWLREHLSYEDKLGFYADLSEGIRDIVGSAFALASPRADSDERTAGAKAVSARTLAGMLRSRIERAAEHKSETVSLGQFFADQIHRYLTEAGHGPEHDARIGDGPAGDGDLDCDSGRDWGLRARQVHLEALSKRAAGGKWFASTNGSDGLARLDNGTDGMFPVRGEWHEIEFIEALVNAYRNGDCASPRPNSAEPTTEEVVRLRAALTQISSQYVTHRGDLEDDKALAAIKQIAEQALGSDGARNAAILAHCDEPRICSVNWRVTTGISCGPCERKAFGAGDR